MITFAASVPRKPWHSAVSSVRRPRHRPMAPSPSQTSARGTAPSASMSCHQPAIQILCPPGRDQHRRGPPRIPGHHRQHRQQLRRPHLPGPGGHLQYRREPEITLGDLPGRITGPRRRVRRQVGRPQLRDPPAQRPDRIRPPDPLRDHRRRHRRIRLQQLPDPRLERIHHRPRRCPPVLRRPVTGQRRLHRVPRDPQYPGDLRDRHALRPPQPAVG